MIKLIFGIYFSFLINGCTTLSSSRVQTIKQIDETNYWREIFLSKNVIWQFHFGKYYKNSMVSFIAENDTLCNLKCGNTNTNECTNTFVSLYDKGNYFCLYIDNNDKLDSTYSKKTFFKSDSIKLSIVIDSLTVRFNNSLIGGNFFHANLYHGSFQCSQTKNFFSCR